MLSLHRLVQAVQQARMTPEKQRQWAERLVLAMQAVFPRIPQNGVAAWPTCQRYLEHVLACDALIQQHHLLLAEGADMLDRDDVYLLEQAIYHLAEPLLQRALVMREQLLISPTFSTCRTRPRRQPSCTSAL